MCLKEESLEEEYENGGGKLEYENCVERSLEEDAGRSTGPRSVTIQPGRPSQPRLSRNILFPRYLVDIVFICAIEAIS